MQNELLKGCYLQSSSGKPIKVINVQISKIKPEPFYSVSLNNNGSLISEGVIAMSTIQIFIKTLTGNTFVLDVDLDDSVMLVM